MNIRRGDLSEVLKAAGRIIAGLAMLHFKAFFWALRLSWGVGLAAAGVRAALRFQPMMLFGVALILLGGGFVVWTHALVMRFPVSTGVLITDGPFGIVRHPMYSGCCLVAIGSAAIAKLWPITVLTVLSVVLMLSVSCAEDEENAEIFGAAYRRYSSDVCLCGICIGLLRLLLHVIQSKHNSASRGKNLQQSGAENGK